MLGLCAVACVSDDVADPADDTRVADLPAFCAPPIVGFMLFVLFDAIVGVCDSVLALVCVRTG